ncbi:MAG: S-methyl-5-thioribose-1-phosphate isomerase [Candidatus Omnitrophica bacterium]|nr:S-methyl-5-thioribose-1-phosphate isomerase [Candidatus Omnitrophota bacterium]
MKRIQTIEWQKNKIKIIDQTKLPQKLLYIYIKDIKTLWQAIKQMKIRGAPALGIAGALGIYLGIKDIEAKNFKEFKERLDKVARYLFACRPTARNLFYGIERMYNVAVGNKDKSVLKIKELILEEAKKMIEEEKDSCYKIASYGARLIKDKDRVLTICNAGILATLDYGTALGIIYKARQEGKRLRVFACETRPLLQGSRLTAWELKQKGIDVTVICDNMAATLMQQGKIDKVITGADRIAANGDVANKIGTYNLAILAKFHRIPFYVAAPITTFDRRIKSGKDIPIEERDKKEVITLLGKIRIAPCNVKVFNPAFDVTPNNLITAIITDKGIIPPKNIRDTLSAKAKGAPRWGHPSD